MIGLLLLPAGISRVAQVLGEDQVLSIQDLFSELKFTDFPDQINVPTLVRLNQFLMDAKLPEVQGMTVRAIVQRMLKINVPPGCQCWQVYNSQCMANVDHLSAEQRRIKRVLELQRVVVNCSRPVFGIMQEAYQEMHTNELAQGRTEKAKVR